MCVVPVKVQHNQSDKEIITFAMLERIFGEVGNNENIEVDLLIGANCLEAPKPLEVIPGQDKGPYTFRTALRWCVVGPMKTQQLDLISCNRIGVMKASPQDTAEHQFEIEKKLKNLA